MIYNICTLYLHFAFCRHRIAINVTVLRCYAVTVLCIVSSFFYAPHRHIYRYPASFCEILQKCYVFMAISIY